MAQEEVDVVRGQGSKSKEMLRALTIHEALRIRQSHFI